MHKLKQLSLVMLSFLLLAGCQTVANDTHWENKNTLNKSNYTPTKNDSAPSGPPPTTFTEVKPKSSPLSRYGNPATYSVDGEKYNVMLNADGYHDRGIASWYGTKFHTKRTSSGEKYDMYALTAAHKTLPLPTYIKVRNLENNREAIIKVNDRGPFHEGRILDLSYGAANKLGIFPKGTAMVEIEAISSGTEDAHYYLQVGAFESNNTALKLKAEMDEFSKKPVFISKVNHKYLVRIGPFLDKKMSDSFKEVLKKKGVSGVFSMIM
ncbi:MAG: septal ring lytic transglycosylase RlpA family protein [Legionellaceae bacterium]|nr:septal ring lytic transglycosylase RlpA family protein [Legionellaceae bacterium]